MEQVKHCTAISSIVLHHFLCCVVWVQPWRRLPGTKQEARPGFEWGISNKSICKHNTTIVSQETVACVATEQLAHHNLNPYSTNSFMWFLHVL